jgi:hypothetical protein
MADESKLKPLTREGLFAYFDQGADANGRIDTSAEWLADIGMLIVHETQGQVKAETADLRGRLAELEKAVHSAVYGIDCMKLNSVAYTPDSIREGLTTALTKLQENK